MLAITSYLTFSGNCREAMTFYKECLGGTLNLQAIGDSPLSEEMPEKMRNCILHATLINGPLVLMGSDMVADEGLTRGNAVSLLLQCSSEDEMRACYKALSAGGKATNPPGKTFWGALFGGLTDKFGNHWLLNCEKEKQ